MTTTSITSMPPGREIDDYIATRIMRWKLQRTELGNENWIDAYKGDIAATANRVYGGWTPTVETHGVEAVNSWKYHPTINSFAPSYSLNDAFQVVKLFTLKGFTVKTEINPDNSVVAHFQKNGITMALGVANNIPLAICRAAIEYDEKWGL